MAYALVQLGREKEAIARLEEAYKASLETGEQRHQVAKTALDAARVCTARAACIRTYVRMYLHTFVCAMLSTFIVRAV